MLYEMKYRANKFLKLYIFLGHPLILYDWKNRLIATEFFINQHFWWFLITLITNVIITYLFFHLNLIILMYHDYKLHVLKMFVYETQLCIF